ncbi:MAG TPA: MFS transporter [SAR202 cluster bacterium]|nr:MFS transporter [SAR202 cluster bacterium]|tara:strand:+ start:308 stop:1732 length:1425 start_codon:yes stop_codon:yes gene_type:complete
MNRPLIPFLAISLGVFCMVVDQGGIMLALPSISRFFDSDLSTTQWVLIGYVLSISASLLPMSRISDLLGHKKIYVWGLTLVAATTIFAGFSNSIGLLIVLSLVRGVGSGMTQGTSMALVLSIFASSQGGKALGLYISVVGIGSGVGPLIAGFILNSYSWRFLYFFLGGLGVISAAAVSLLVRSNHVSSIKFKEFRFDWIGAALFTIGIASLLQTTTWGSRIGFSNPITIGIACLSLAGFAGFIYKEMLVEEPMIDLRLFRNKLFSSGVSAHFLFFAATSCSFFFMPFFLEIVAGYSPQQIGFIMGAGAISMSIAGAFCGYLSDKFGPFLFSIGGFVVAALGLLVLTNLTVEATWKLAIIGMLSTSMANGIFFGPNNKQILGSVSRSFHGVISGFMHTTRNSGSAIGISIGTAIATSVMAYMGYEPTLSDLTSDTATSVLDSFVRGIKFVFWGGVVVLILGIFVLVLGGRSKVNN